MSSENNSSRLQRFSDTIYTRTSEVAEKIGPQLTLPIAGEQQDYIRLLREEAKIFSSVQKYIKKVKNAANALTGVLNFVANIIPLDHFDFEIMRRDTNRDINKYNETLKKQINQQAARREPRKWAVEDEARHARWITATAALFLSEAITPDDKEGVKDEIQTLIRRVLVDGTAKSARIEGSLVDEEWVLKELIPLITTVTDDIDTNAHKEEMFALFVNEPQRYNFK